MEIEFYKPHSPLLRKYIDCFYTLKHLAQDKTTRYLAFPNILTIVTVVKNAQISVKENNVKMVHCPNVGVKTNIVCRFNEPALIQHEGKISEIVMLFKPLGINAFFNTDLNTYSTEHYPTFEPFDDFRLEMTDIISLKNVEAQFEALEDYWLSKLKGFDHPFLSGVVNDLMVEDDLSISEIASKYKISRMTLNKHFKIHTGKTPAQFKKIVRFRKALKKYSIKRSEDQLIDIAHYLNYFDQSHMIKDFKALTGYSPKDFFAKISKLDDGQINWVFL